MNVAGIFIFIVIIVCDIWVLGWSFSHQGELGEFQMMLMISFLLVVTATLLLICMVTLPKLWEHFDIAKENNRLLKEMGSRSYGGSSEPAKKPDEVIWKR